MVIRKLSTADTGYIAEICHLLVSSYDPKITKYLIYRDCNYRSYLTDSLVGARDQIYVALTAGGDMMGFAQIKLLESAIFLNNIIITPRFRGAGVASGLLKVAITDIQKDVPKIETFMLDVFEKNSDTLNWYLRLGMNICHTKWWYNLSDAYKGYNAVPGSSRISISEDKAGFTQVYYDDTQLGTLIVGSELLMRSKFDLDVFNDLKDYFGDKLEGLCLIAEKALNYPLIDRSFQLQVELSKMDFIKR